MLRTGVAVLRSKDWSLAVSPEDWGSFLRTSVTVLRSGAAVLRTGSDDHRAMPKKFKGENSKAVEAKARKTAAQTAEEEAKQRRLEDEFWQDDDKHLLKKQQRKVRHSQLSVAVIGG